MHSNVTIQAWSVVLISGMKTDDYQTAYECQLQWFSSFQWNPISSKNNVAVEAEDIHHMDENWWSLKNSAARWRVCTIVMLTEKFVLNKNQFCFGLYTGESSILIDS